MAAECLLGMMHRIVFQQIHFQRSYRQSEAAAYLYDFFLRAMRPSSERTGHESTRTANNEATHVDWDEGQALALAQTNEVVDSLRKVAPQFRCEVVSIKTQADTIAGASGRVRLEGKSVFTKEIEDSLIQGHVDLAVHSMKDLTTDLPPGLVIACVPERVDPRDVLISRDRKKFEQLDGGARVGTSSARRKAQLLAGVAT